MFIFNFDKPLISCLRKLFIFIELNLRIFCDYTNDGFTTVLIDTKSRGFDSSCLPPSYFNLGRTIHAAEG